MTEERTRLALLAVLAGLTAAVAGTVARRRRAAAPSGAPDVPAVEPSTSRGELPASPGGPDVPAVEPTRGEAPGPPADPDVPAVEPSTSRGEPPASSGGPASSQGEAPVSPGESTAQPERDEPQTFVCSCGQEYRTTGVGRHRVYWPADASEADPVLGDACPACGTPLPADPTGAAA